MPPRLTWSNLIPGLLALTVLVAIAMAVVFMGGIGGVRGDTIRLYVVTDQAHGVIGGTDVWLVGQKVGTVEGVGFRAPTSDSARVVLQLDVRREDAGQIRRDSYATIRTGGNIIGPAVVYLSAGTPASPAARDGDTLRATQRDFEVALRKAGSVLPELRLLAADVRTVFSNVRERRGSLGHALAANGNGDVGAFRDGFESLRSTLSSSYAPKLFSAMPRVRTALARADSIRALLASSDNSLGRFRRDTTLATAVTSLRAELAEVRTRLASGDGFLARSAADSSIVRALASAQREMTLLSEDMRRRPLRYIIF